MRHKAVCIPVFSGLNKVGECPQLVLSTQNGSAEILTSLKVNLRDFAKQLVPMVVSSPDLEFQGPSIWKV